MFKNVWLILVIVALCSCNAVEQENAKPRILISSDIGGTDPDDNQSMIHFLMYSDLFQNEGLVSSPSYGEGSREEIERMIDLYEADFPKLKENNGDYPSADELRAVCKQGRKGAAPYAGYQSATEGSNWIIKCAMKESSEPLWVLVWGGLDDLAQALHDEPAIQDKIRVYWIGGPNKKWSANSYAYIAQNYPDLWFIEANAVYRGFFSNTGSVDSFRNENFYKNFIAGKGKLGKSFADFYGGRIKMGDTPSLLYVMNGDPGDPEGESWGGSFEKMSTSPRYIFNRSTTDADTVKVYSIVEYHLEGPELSIPSDSACFTMTVYAGVGEQSWSGYYLGAGKYAVRYAPKKAEKLRYEIYSEIPSFPEQSGELIVKNTWPGNVSENDYSLGSNWYTDPVDPRLFDKGWQGAMTVLKWRQEALTDWSKRWDWLK